MARHSRPKNGSLPLAYVPAIHVFLARSGKDVDARHKAGHGDVGALAHLDKWTFAQPRHSRWRLATVCVDIDRWLRHRAHFAVVETSSVSPSSIAERR
jgi:hypothetical protein